MAPPTARTFEHPFVSWSLFSFDLPSPLLLPRRAPLHPPNSLSFSSFTPSPSPRLLFLSSSSFPSLYLATCLGQNKVTLLCNSVQWRSSRGWAARSSPVCHFRLYFIPVGAGLYRCEEQHTNSSPPRRPPPDLSLRRTAPYRGGRE